MSRTLFVLFALLLVCGCSQSSLDGASSADASSPAAAAEAASWSNPGAKPATVAAAAKVLDLRKLALPDGAKPAGMQTLAVLSFRTKGGVADVYAAEQKRLKAAQWQVLPGGYTSDQSASGTFTREGFLLSLSAHSAGESGLVDVNYSSHGNVAPNSLPAPAGSRQLYAFPASAAHVSELAPTDAANQVRKLLADQGWEPYGIAGETYFFRQNAIRLTALIAAAPAQGGKTAITYSTELMSSEIPAPADATRVQYADTTTTLSLDTPKARDELAAFYRQALAPAGWNATLDKLIEIDRKQVLIFRNPAKDMLTLELATFEGQTRAEVIHQTAAQVADLERREKAAAMRKLAMKKLPPPKLALSIPKEAQELTAEADSLEFKLPSGMARPVIDGWRKELESAGWKEAEAALDPLAGTVSLEKGPHRLSISYVETGLLPSEISVMAIGVEITKP